jgi:hypothetical protein
MTTARRGSDMPKAKAFTGRVVKVPWGKGSKGEHEAVCLVTGDEQLKLRRPGGNPFVDREVEKLVGKSIRVEGTLIDPSTLLMTSWSEID